MKKGMGVLVVVGGSRGIGAAIARRSMRDGYAVAVGYHSSDRAASLLSDEALANGGTLRAIPVNVVDSVSVENFFCRVDEELGSPVAMVYAAGITGEEKSLIHTPPESVAHVLNTNLLGAFHSVQSAARRMARSVGGNGGAIVIITSETGKFGGNNMSPYAASKAGLNALVVGAARELVTQGIRLNGVSPGVIDTDQHADISPERLGAFLSSIPMGRMGRPEEVANAVSWLLSNEASYAAGSILSITGGR